jgi:glycosyltransferase involved in cell wall biosynthesis
LVTALRTPPGTRDGWREVLGRAREAIDQLGEHDLAFIFPGPLIRRLVQWLDRDALDLNNIKHYAAISRTVAERENYFPAGVAVDVLLPPTNMTDLHSTGYRNFFTASRLDQPKRIDLLIRAMDHVQSSVELRIAGSGPDADRLRAVRPHDNRIVFLGRISDEQLAAEYSAALAVPFVPYDEDFGLVTLEAQLAAKPVITCSDSGGVTELVTDKVSGRVVPPDVVELGRAMDELAQAPELARMMGEEGRRAALLVTWEQVVESLVPGQEGPTAVSITGGSRPTLLVLSTYPAEPARHGGQIRLNRLLRGLAERFEVQLIALDHGQGKRGVTEPYPGIRQTIVPCSQEHRRLEGALAARSPIPIGDIAASLFVQHTQGYVDAIKAVGRNAVGAVLEQPFLLPALARACPRLPFVYDSQNAEADMKETLLAGSDLSPELVGTVRAVEQHAVRGAELVGVCSTEDRIKLERLGPTLADWVLVPNGSDVLETPFVSGAQRAGLRRAWLARFAERHPYAAPEHLALFVGSYHPPNLEAAEFIVNLAILMPDVCFVLVGSQGLYFDTWKLPYNVVVTGLIGDHELHRLLASADVALNPITSGGGTNLKLIEYFAAGVPVVSTPLGTRGTSLRDGTELVISEPADFADSIRAVLTDPSTAEVRAKQARLLAEASYDWAPIATAFSNSVATAFGLD